MYLDYKNMLLWKIYHTLLYSSIDLILIFGTQPYILKFLLVASIKSWDSILKLFCDSLLPLPFQFIIPVILHYIIAHTLPTVSIYGLRVFPRFKTDYLPMQHQFWITCLKYCYCVYLARSVWKKRIITKSCL